MMWPPLVGSLRPMTRRLAAVVIGSQAPVVLFAAVGLYALVKVEQGAGSRADAVLFAGLGVVTLCILSAAMLRFPWGVTLGWLAQVACLASALLQPSLLVIGGIFLALWWTALVQGERIERQRQEWAEHEPQQERTGTQGLR